MCSGPVLCNDVERRELDRLLSTERSLHESALALGYWLDSQPASGRLLYVLRALLTGGLLHSTTHQIRALYMLHAMDKAAAQPVLVTAAADEAAPAAVRLIALQLLGDGTPILQLGSVTALEFQQKCDSTMLEGAPTLADLIEQHLCNGLQGPQGVFGAGAALRSLQPLAQHQALALDLLQLWATSSGLDAMARQQAAEVHAQLELFFLLQHTCCTWPAGAAVQVVAQKQPDATAAGSRQQLPGQHMLGAAVALDKVVQANQQQQLLWRHQEPQANGTAHSEQLPLHQLHKGEAAGPLAGGLQWALEQAHRRPLVPAQQQQLLGALQSTILVSCGGIAAAASSVGSRPGLALPPAAGGGRLDHTALLASLRGMDAQRFGSLVECNPSVAAEVISTASRLHAASGCDGSDNGAGSWRRLAERFMEACSELPMSTQSIECMTLVVNGGPPPDDLLRRFVYRCMACIDATQDAGRQGRLVKLLCAFVGHLVQRSPGCVLGMQEELAAFCIQFSRVAQAAELFRRLKLLLQDADGEL